MKEVHILLAEDNEDHIFLTIKAIEKAKNEFAYVVHVVQDGQEAIDFVKRIGKHSDSPKPDLILLDIKMPKKDGFEVLKELKGDSKYKKIPIIMITSSESEADIAKSYELGSNSYVIKPMEYEALMSKLKEIPEYWCKINSLPPKEA
jgi:CheY-like chemotaxis protein